MRKLAIFALAASLCLSIAPASAASTERINIAAAVDPTPAPVAVAASGNVLVAPAYNAIDRRSADRPSYQVYRATFSFVGRRDRRIELIGEPRMRLDLT